MKPVIGITCKRRGLGMDDYIYAVTEFGGVPLMFAALDRCTEEHLDSIPDYLDQIDGLLLPGGGDMIPYVYFKKWDRAITKNVSLSPIPSPIIQGLIPVVCDE